MVIGNSIVAYACDGLMQCLITRVLTYELVVARYRDEGSG